MSAFIVSAGCIDTIVAYLSLHADRFRWLKGKLGYDVSREEDLDALTSALYGLSCRAVDERHGEGAAARDTEEAPACRYQPVIRDGVAAYKAVCCLLHQCREGDMPETPLYKAMEEVSRVIADEVVSNLPGFKRAPCGG